jgi:hypothetical protein
MHNLKTLRNYFWSNLLGRPLTHAESSASIPPELKTLLSSIEVAANQHDLEKVMQFYSPNFTNSDGLNQMALAQALTQLWKNYDNLSYRTEVQSWDKIDNEWMAETVTYIQGTTQDKARPTRLDATIKSRQYFQDQKLTRQEILTERTHLTSGSNPPDVDVRLPEKIRVGQEFDFDVIIQEPLGDNLLLGTALEEKINSDLYLKPSTLELEALPPAGGIFKRAKAPTIPENYWLSAVLVRGDGITQVTQRIMIEK